MTAELHPIRQAHDESLDGLIDRAIRSVSQASAQDDKPYMVTVETNSGIKFRVFDDDQMRDAWARYELNVAVAVGKIMDKDRA